MEIFKDIKGYEGLYQVSNLGRVKSLPKEVVIYNGGSYKTKVKFLKPKLCNHYGYLTFNLNGKFKKQHRLVAEAFIPNPENKPQVNHIDSDKTNNTIDNLEWVTASENTIHAYKNKLIKNNPYKGIDNNGSKFTKEDIITIRNSNDTQRAIGKKYGVSHVVIGRIINNKSYKNI